MSKYYLRRFNYRTAQKGETKCGECGHYSPPGPCGGLGSCDNALHYCVGKNHTCDYAQNASCANAPEAGGE
jgi:hypothetical protein